MYESNYRRRQRALIMRLSRLYVVAGAGVALAGIAYYVFMSLETSSESQRLAVLSTFAGLFMALLGAAIPWLAWSGRISGVEFSSSVSPIQQDVEVGNDGSVPYSYFLLRWNLLERQLQSLVGHAAPGSLRRLINQLVANGDLSESDADRFFQLLSVRNDLLHGNSQPTVRDLVGFVDEVSEFSVRLERTQSHPTTWSM